MAATVRPFHHIRSPEVIQIHRHSAMLHAVRRGSERGPAPITEDDYHAHELVIMAGAARKLRFYPRSTLYAIQDRGGVYYPVWCRRLQGIVTYLQTPSCFRDTGRSARGDPLHA